MKGLKTYLRYLLRPAFYFCCAQPAFKTLTYKIEEYYLHSVVMIRKERCKSSGW